MKSALGIALTPGGTRAMRRWKPFSVTAFGMLRALRALDLEPRTIIDAGANVGQFARAATETFPRARVIAFEPLPGVANTLRANLRDRLQVEVRAQGLGSTDGATTIHRNRYSPASSMLKLRTDAAQSFDLQEAEVVEVDVVRLDNALAGEDLELPMLLKLDLQGYELEALRGAQETLARTQHVLVELGLRPMYEEEPSFDEVYAALRDAGFRFVGPVALLRDDRGRVSQMDAVFEAARPAGSS